MLSARKPEEADDLTIMVIVTIRQHALICALVDIFYLNFTIPGTQRNKAWDMYLIACSSTQLTPDGLR